MLIGVSSDGEVVLARDKHARSTPHPNKSRANGGISTDSMAEGSSCSKEQGVETVTFSRGVANAVTTTFVSSRPATNCGRGGLQRPNSLPKATVR
jgi:hypothetical protein